MYVTFKRRKHLPKKENAVRGTFYWIDDTSESESENTSELWFCSSKGLVRIDNYYTYQEVNDIISRLSDTESDIERIQEILNEINDRIESIVNNKLIWQII